MLVIFSFYPVLCSFLKDQQWFNPFNHNIYVYKLILYLKGLISMNSHVKPQRIEHIFFNNYILWNLRIYQGICGLFFISTSSFIWFLIWFLSYNIITPVITKLSFYLQLAACRRRVQSSSQWLNILSLEVVAGKWQVFISLLYTRQRQREREVKEIL